jgi:hypothetical protein
VFGQVLFDNFSPRTRRILGFEVLLMSFQYILKDSPFLQVEACFLKSVRGSHWIGYLA